MRRLFRQFSFPGGIPSHVAPETPGSIHEGGELGYALAHAYGAAFDNPDLLVCCVVGDGEAETGPLAASWHSNKFLDPRATARCCRSCTSTATRSPTRPCSRASRTTSCARCSRATATSRCSSRATTRRRMHQLMAATLDRALDEIAAIQSAARGGARDRPAALADDRPAHAEGLDRAEGGRRPAGRGHVPLAPGAARRARARSPEHLAGSSRRGCARYRPEELFDERRRARAPSSRALAPDGRAAHGRQPARQRRPAAARPASCPTSATTRSTFERPATTSAEATRVLGAFLRDVHAHERRPRRSGSSGPTRRRRTASAPCSRSPTARGRPSCSPTDDHLAPDGRVMEVLSEHLCQGWLEGYLLTGRHGLFNCYEAFIHIVDSMFNQHAKWLKVTRGDPVAAADRVAELPAHLARLAPGPQRLLPPGPGLHRPRRQQEGRDRPRLPAAGRQLPAVGRRPLPAQPRLRQRHRRRQAAGAATT